jgi:hypothetical protein
MRSPSAAGSDVRSSSHICLPFETEDEKHEATVTFIHEGLSRGARCLFLGTKDDYETLGRGLGAGHLYRKATSAAPCSSAPSRDLIRREIRSPRALDKTDADRRGARHGLPLPQRGLTNVPDQETGVDHLVRSDDQQARRGRPRRCVGTRERRCCPNVRGAAHASTAIVRGESCETRLRAPEIVLTGDASQLDWQFRQLRVHHRLASTRGHLLVGGGGGGQLAGELHYLRSVAKSRPPD